MRTSEIAVAVLCAVLPAAAFVVSCLDASTCLRNSDCPAADICSVGACIPAPSDTPPADGSVDDVSNDAPSADTDAPRDVAAADAVVRVDSGDAGDGGDAGDAGSHDGGADALDDGSADATRD